MQETGYKVVWPLGKTLAQPVKLANRVSDLRNKIVCEISDYGFRSEEIFPLVRELLSNRYPGIKFVEYTNFGNTHGPDETEIIASLPDKLRAFGCDVVISGVGG
jgi:hypothetical protein